MKKPTRGVFEILAFLLVVLVAVFSASRAQAEPASDPAGFYRITCLGNSDTIVSIPFTRPAVANVVVQSVDNENSQVTVKGTPGWTSDQFVYVAGMQTNTFYARFLSGGKEGSYYPVTANDEDSLTLSLGEDVISGVLEGDQLAVIPYWTLATAFPNGRGIHDSPNPADRKTEIRIPDFAGSGINLAPGTPYYFWGGFWRKTGSLAITDDDVLLPDVYFIVRHNVATNTVFTAQGSVAVSKLVTPLVTQVATGQDNPVALLRPVQLTLNNSDLIQSGAFLASPTPASRTDQLFVFDNNQAAKNKAPGPAYYFWNNAWRRVGSLVDVGDEVVLLPGAGIRIRKAATLDGDSTLWTSTPTY